MRRLSFILLAMLALGSIASNRKLSPWLRQIATRASQQHGSARRAPAAKDSLQTIAFIRISGSNADSILAAHSGRSLAHFGNIHIAMLPLSQLEPLSRLEAVDRIEARQPNSLLMDSAAIHIHATPIYEGRALPHHYTGRGVVMGVQDIGFDLTHPNFFSPDLRDYRIKAFWDMLSADTVGSAMPVGADYIGREALLAYGHSRDGLDQTHGTNTLGMAAGSGYATPYRGMAFESDICIVSNAVSEDIVYVDSTDYYKYTSATDVLGFKYIFDYAAAQGKPCVISFSEGSAEGFYESDELLYAVLDSLSGPGRIIMAAAGNKGETLAYFHKPAGPETAGTYIVSGHNALLQFKADHAFDIRFVTHGQQTDTLVIGSQHTFGQIDSVYADTLVTDEFTYTVNTMAYPSCYNPRDTVVEAYIEASHSIGSRGEAFSVETVSAEADVECFLGSGRFTNDETPGSHLAAAEKSHTIHSPGSAPRVICVGGTTHRSGFYDVNGKWQKNDQKASGRLTHTSIGPTVDGRIKPDVMAPGNNVISSYCSFYLETHPDANDNKKSTVMLTEIDGRQYPWTANSGTSMSCPVAAGTVALWLEARPDLTPEDVMDAIRHTSRQFDPTLDYPNSFNGYGEIDAYYGLLYLLGIDAIRDVSSTPAQGLRQLPSPPGTLRLQVSPSESKSEAMAITLRLYSLQGSLLGTWHVDGPATPEGIVTITLPPSATSIAALQADSPNPQFQGSLLVRCGQR